MLEEEKDYIVPDFSREACKGCKFPVGFFKIKDGRLCWMCLHKVKQDTGLSLDEIHDIDSKQVLITLESESKHEITKVEDTESKSNEE